MRHRSVWLLACWLSFTGIAFAGQECAGGAPSVSRCPGRYLPTPQAPSVMPASVGTAIEYAKQALREEREAVQIWLDARKAQQEMTEKLKRADLPANERADLKGKYQKVIKDYRIAAEKLKDRKSLSDSAAAAAVKAVVQHFQLTPPKTDLNDTQASSHRLSPWAPAFKRDEVFDSDTRRWRLRTPKEQEIDEQRRNANTSQTDGRLGPTTALTSWYDGAMTLNQNAFSSPEALAGTVYHETSHWVAIMAFGGYRKGSRPSPANFFQMEVDAYRREADFYRNLGKPDEAANRADVATRYKAQLDVTISRRLTWSDIQTNQAYRGWLGVDSALGLSSPNEAPPASDERDDALREIQEGALALRARHEAESDRRIREVSQSSESQEDKRAVHMRMASAAIGCGLEPDDTWKVRFRSGDNDLLSFQFQDEDAFRASILLLQACYADKKAPPCVDAFAAIRARWDEPGFREKLHLDQGSPDDAASCVAGLAATRKKPDSYKDLLRARDRFWAQWRRERNSGAQTPLPPSTREPGPPRERPDPVPPRNDLPWCMQAPGRRCID